MRGAAGAARVVVLTLGMLALWATGCENPVAAFTGLTEDSSVVDGHSHRVTIPARDINDPTGNRSYETSTAGSTAHSHGIELTQTQLQDLQQDGAFVEVLTSRKNNHAHTFRFVR